MNTSSNGYVLGFSVVVCVVMSAALALTATALKPLQAASAEFDRQKNVMIAAGLVRPGDTRSRPELEQLYQQRVTETVIEKATGKPAEGITPKDYAAMKEQEQKRYAVVATTRGDDGKLGAIVLPVSGKGLWSTIRGYLALEGDANTVRGITFYSHGETPGLGGEVENPTWTAQWEGKHILAEDGNLFSIVVKKGKVDPTVPKEERHYVDGLSGATITSNGVTKFVRADLEGLRPYLSQYWNNR